LVGDVKVGSGSDSVAQAGIRKRKPIANRYLTLANILRPLMNKD